MRSDGPGTGFCTVSAKNKETKIFQKAEIKAVQGEGVREEKGRCHQAFRH